MATGIRSGGVDFDDLFDPDTVGDGPVAAWLESGGVALKYARLAYGSKRADVGYRSSAGVDVSNLWAAKGTASYVIAGLDGKVVSVGEVAATRQEVVNASAEVNLLNNGTWSTTGGTSNGPADIPEPDSGPWNTHGGVASDYDVQFDVTDSGHADRQVSNGAPAWASLGSTRDVSIVLPSASGNNAKSRAAIASVRIRVRRRSTGQVMSDSGVSLRVSTDGFA